MEYLTGYTIKPHRVTAVGEVLFTDGTNVELMTNQITCEAYGYTFDRATGTCRAFRYNTNLERNISNTNNKNNGAGNSTELGSNTIQINGSNNTTKGFNNNCFINGSDNEISNGINNATVLGSNGTALRDGELLLGGGGAGATSLFLLSANTEDAAATALLINGDSSLIYIPRQKADVYTYTVDVLAYRTGGSSGSGAVGDRTFLKLEGILFGTTASEAQTSKIAVGTVAGWTVATAFTGTDVSIKVTGVVGMDITWQATARFNELIIT